jgi:hypothetical protein
MPGHSIHVVGGLAHQVAGALSVEERRFEALQFIEDGVAEFELDVAAGAHNPIAHDVAEQPGK